MCQWFEGIAQIYSKDLMSQNNDLKVNGSEQVTTEHNEKTGK